MSANDRDVLVTGYGSVSALGATNAAFREGLLSSTCGVSHFCGYDSKGADISSFCAPVSDLKLESHDTRLTYNRLDSVNRNSLVASKTAIGMAGLDPSQALGLDTGLVMATTYSGAHVIWQNMMTIKKKGARYVTPLKWSAGINSTLSIICMEYGITGYNCCINSGVVSGNSAIKMAFDRISSQQDERIIIVSGDPFDETLYRGCTVLGILAQTTRELRGPFDRDRSGIALGEACGVLVLESRYSAEARGAPIFGKLTGIAFGSDGLRITKSDGQGLVQAIRKAFCMSAIDTGDLDFVYSSGNATEHTDRVEAAALGQVFGRRRSPPVTALRSLIGETISAGGVLDVIAAIETIKSGRLPAIANLNQLDDKFVGINAVTSGVRGDFKTGLINSVGPGGDCFSIVIEQYPYREDA